MFCVPSTMSRTERISNNARIISIPDRSTSYILWNKPNITNSTKQLTVIFGNPFTMLSILFGLVVYNFLPTIFPKLDGINSSPVCLSLPSKCISIIYLSILQKSSHTSNNLLYCSLFINVSHTIDRFFVEFVGVTAS